MVLMNLFKYGENSLAGVFPLLHHLNDDQCRSLYYMRATPPPTPLPQILLFSSVPLESSRCGTGLYQRRFQPTLLTSIVSGNLSLASFLGFCLFSRLVGRFPHLGYVENGTTSSFSPPRPRSYGARRLGQNS